MLMRCKVVFLALAVLWVTAATQPAANAMNGYCGDGFCDTGPCFPGSVGTCEEQWTCSADCPGSNPCDSPSPHWVVVSSVQVGAFMDMGSTLTRRYCRHFVTNLVTERDMQSCIAARQPDRRSCFYSEDAQLRDPDENQCCNWFWCGGSGPICPA